MGGARQKITALRKVSNIFDIFGDRNIFLLRKKKKDYYAPSFFRTLSGIILAGRVIRLNKIQKEKSIVVKGRHGRQVCSSSSSRHSSGAPIEEQRSSLCNQSIQCNYSAQRNQSPRLVGLLTNRPPKTTRAGSPCLDYGCSSNFACCPNAV